MSITNTRDNAHQPAGKTVVMNVTVHFGDCDPADIVFFPNFMRWLDAASLDFWMTCGLPPWRVSKAEGGFAGSPVLEVNTRFIKAATYGETLQIHTSIAEWRGKVFIEQQQIRRGDELLCEARVTRIFVKHDPQTGALKGVDPGPEVRALCS